MSPGELAVLLRQCRQGANAAEKAGRLEEAAALRVRAGELAEQVRAIGAARTARAEAEARARWEVLSARMVECLLVLAREGVRF
jgi:hypothetical protein